VYSNQDKGIFDPISELNNFFRLAMVGFVRAGRDLVNLYYVYDEYVEVGNVSEAKAASTLIATMRNPEAKCDNSHVLDKMIRQ